MPQQTMRAASRTIPSPTQSHRSRPLLSYRGGGKLLGDCGKTWGAAQQEEAEEESFKACRTHGEIKFTVRKLLTNGTNRIETHNPPPPGNGSHVQIRGVIFFSGSGQLGAAFKEVNG